MKDFIVKFLEVLEIIGIAGIALYSVWGVLNRIFGPILTEKLFEKLGLSIGYGWIIVIGIGFLGIAFLAHFLRKKLL